MRTGPGRVFLAAGLTVATAARPSPSWAQERARERAPAPSPAPSTAPSSGASTAQARPHANPAPVSREEYDRLRREVEALRRELAEVKKERESQSQETDEALEEIETTVAGIKKDLRDREGGSSNFLMSGNATFSYFDRDNDDSTFTAVFRPLFLGKLSDRLFFEGKPEIRLRANTEDASFALEYANLSYVANDYVIVGVGKFLTPFGLFADRFYPGKLLEEPLVYQRFPVGIAPHSDVGAFARGAFPVGPWEANYAAWVSNGPVLRTTDAARAGALDFGGSFRDVNDNKAVGARVGFLPVTSLEVGGSILYAEADPHGFQQTPVRLYGVDAQYFDTIRPLAGAVDVRVEWVWSVVDDATYDPAGALGFGPLTFGNRRNGGYVEASYRPYLVDNRHLHNLEFVSRYDWLEVPDAAPGPADERRLTVAVLYWVNATTSLRAGYLFSDAEGPDRDAFFMQASVGF